jgi:hypothetical protein
MPLANMSTALGYAPSQQVSTTLVYGYVSTEQPAPTSLADPAYIVVPSHSSEHSIPMSITGFPATEEVPLPVRGTTCLVGYDERNGPWIVSWSGPYASPVASG